MRSGVTRGTMHVLVATRIPCCVADSLFSPRLSISIFRPLAVAPSRFISPPHPTIPALRSLGAMAASAVEWVHGVIPFYDLPDAVAQHC